MSVPAKGYSEILADVPASLQKLCPHAEVCKLGPGDVIDMYHIHLPPHLAPNQPQPETCQVHIEAETEVHTIGY